MSILTNNGKVFTLDGKALYALTVSTALNDNTWEVIRKVSDAGTGANYWSVGDTKTITINGTVGKTTFNNLSIDCFILGFNHNAEKEGNNRIHFGIGKSGDKLIGLVDEKYNSTVSTTGYFSINDSETNLGGWKDCQLRNTVLQGSITSKHPIENTLLSALPSDLFFAIKSVTKYTDNKGNATGSIESNVTATKDYLFIPSVFEVIASDTNNVANTYEAAQQQQYDYFKNGNSKLAYKYNDTSTAVNLWLRSPLQNSNKGFCRVYDSNIVAGFPVNYSNAILPCFCV